MKKLVSLMILSLSFNLFGQTNYQNSKYGFSVQVPSDWKVYSEIKDDPENKIAIIDWGLPKVYSELEKTSIENAISVTAYKRKDIKNIDELMKFEFERVEHILVSKELNSSSPYKSYILITQRNGHKFKSQIVFVFKNNTGYVLNFTATQGTYDLNVKKFNDFVKGVQFFESEEGEKLSAGKTKIRFDGLYVAKTGEFNLNNTKMDIYTYIRFYDDNSVYTQSVNSNDPITVSKWLGKNGRFERTGKYTLEGSSVKFVVSNDRTSDKDIEGSKTDSFNGKITDENKLFLQINYSDGTMKDNWFEFTKTN